MTVPTGRNGDKTSVTDVVALFRYGVIADVLHLDPKTRQLTARLREKAELDYVIPGSLRRHVAAETMRGWVKQYRRGGFDALRSRPRCDLGVSRAIDAAVADLLCAIKEESPGLTVPLVIAAAREHHVAADSALARRPRCTGCSRATASWSSGRRTQETARTAGDSPSSPRTSSG